MSISQASSSFSSSTPPKKFIATTLSTVSSKHLIFSRYDPVQNALHAFFLNMIDEYVTKPWFASISTNKDFQHQLLIFISQLTYGLEERIIKVDWNQVFFADIPYLLKQHANAYEYSKNSILPHLFQSVYPMSFDLVYHSLIPHVAMVDQQSEQDYLRCFVDHALKQLGPSYLSEADLENVLYREILTNLLEFIWNSVSEPDFIILWITFWVTPSRVPSKREKLSFWKHLQLPVYQIWHHFLILFKTCSLLMRRKPTRTDLDLSLLSMLEPILPNSKLLSFFVHVWYTWARTPVRWFLGSIIDAYLEASLHQWLSMYTVAQWIEHLHVFLSPSDATGPTFELTMGPLNEQVKLPLMESKYCNKHLLFLLLDGFIWHVFPEFLNRLTLDWVPKRKPSHNVTKTTVTGITAKHVSRHRKTKSSSSIQPSYRF